MSNLAVNLITPFLMINLLKFDILRQLNRM